MTTSYLSRAASLLTGAALIVATSVVPAQAAAITSILVNTDNVLSATETITSIVFTPITALTTGSTFRISYPSTYTDTLVTGDIAASQAGNGETLTVDSVASDLITVTVTAESDAPTGAVTLTLSNATLAAPASDIGSFGVSTSVGDTGSVLVYTAAANTVAVSATVLPTLSFSLAGSSLALGTLVAGTPTTTASSLSFATNATGGVSVVVRNSTNGLSANGGADAITAVPADTTKATIAGDAATEYYGLRAYDAGDGADAEFVDGASANAYGTAAGSVEFEPMANGADLVVAGSTGPVASTAVAYEVLAQATATTEAGAYSDTLTFTATASF